MDSDERAREAHSRCGQPCARPWSARIERVKWVAERRLAKQDERDEGPPLLVWRDKMKEFKGRIFSKSRSFCLRNQTVRPKIFNLLSLFIFIISSQTSTIQTNGPWAASIVQGAQASLIIGDSAIEIQEVQDDPSNGNSQLVQGQQQQQQQPFISNSDTALVQQQQQHSLTNSQPDIGELKQNEPILQIESPSLQANQQQSHSADVESSANQERSANQRSRLPSGPLKPIGKQQDEDVTDGDKRSRATHDFDIHELNPASEVPDERRELSHILAAPLLPDLDGGDDDGKRIAGKVVDFELTPAGGHNKAKIKKKKKKKKLHEEKAEAFKKWNKKHRHEKKAMEKKEREHMKKKKEEGKKKKKKWGMHVQGLKKKGNFKKKKWGKKVKKGKGVKKGKKGKKFLKDKGHKNTGFKTVYHKEEWGKSAKWHDIKREKKWDEKSKKWKKKWKKEKGKKYKGDHVKKFEKQKKEGKKYKKAKKEQHKKFKKEKFEAGKKKKMEEHGKKKEAGEKKKKMMMKEEKKKKKKP